MKKFISLTAILVGAGILVFNNSNQKEETSKTFEKEGYEEPKKLDPNDYWMQVRSYPDGFDQEQYVQKMVVIQHINQDMAFERAIELNNPWVQEGPGNIGGRFNALAGSPTDQDIIYAGAANGGIFKSTDGGSTWNPIFDDFAYLAIGEIELDPNDENTVWVGTGDKNFGGGSHLGNGVYKSDDAGASWSHIGLEQTGIITEIAIDPTDSDRIFVSTLGNTYEKTTDRGVYRTIDGGTTWTNVLFISDSSGVIDMIMDPSNSDVLYATGFNRINLPFNANTDGPDAEIYKTTDGGNNWTVLSNGLPASGDHSRIGLAISNVTPSTVYASITSGTNEDILDIYRSTDSGASWSPLNVHAGGLPTNAQGNFGWYFGEVYLNPYDNNELIVPGVDMFRSGDGGSTWAQNVPDWWDYTVHADKHAILFLSATSYIIATDGGLYKTTNNGVTWTDIENIPVTQFYHVDADPQNSGIYGGGAQDNGSMRGNASMMNLWERLYGGDGFRQTFMKDEPGGFYFETQNGGIVYYNELSLDWLDLTVNPVDGADRNNWDTPYYLDEDNFELHAGSAHIQEMQGAPWGAYTSVSGDLTKVGIGGAIGADKYHTITEIEKPFDDPDKMFVGTSDGLVWRGDRTGSWNWTNITGTLPDRYCTAVRTSPETNGSVYVAFSGYKLNDPTSYLYKSDDDGATWTDISGNLPGITVNDVWVVPNYNEQWIFAALDGGVYFTSDGGSQWDLVGTGMPMATITEFAVDYDNEKLIAGTYSRSMFSYDISWIDNLNGLPGALIPEQDEVVQFFPNHAEDLVYFQGLDVDEIQLYDLKGRLVLNKKVIKSNGFGQLNISDLPKGVYIFKAEGKTGRVVKG